MAKQYGLIVPNKEKSKTIVRPSIFDEDSDSDHTEEKPTGLAKTVKHQHKLAQSKAEEEDSTVFQYDEVYDEIDRKRKESKLSRKDLDRKPKYISRLLAAADRRKRDNERRIERQVQKEREQEGEEFKDKEEFVTSAYKKKLEELREMDELEKREEYLESIGDVKKQGNLDGFYRHLYEQKVNFDENDQKNTEKPSTVPKSDKKEADKSQKRKYRKQQDSASENEETTKGKADEKKEHLQSNLDADSDFSIDSSDDEDSAKPEIKPEKEPPKEEKQESVSEPVETPPALPPPPKKPKLDIWKKRTVGEVFDAALQRYFERKSIREL